MQLILGDYTKIAIWSGDFSGVGNGQNFLLLGGILPHLQGLSQRFGGRGRTVHTWLGNTQDERRGHFW